VFSVYLLLYFAYYAFSYANGNLATDVTTYKTSSFYFFIFTGAQSETSFLRTAVSI
jgi:hypothetical protein